MNAAFATNTSILPDFSVISEMKLSVFDLSEISPIAGKPPVLSITFFTLSVSAISFTKTLYPSLENSSAVAAPIP